jgi:hypothetical protein
MYLTKSIARSILRADFIPNGGHVDVRTLQFRRTSETEIFRCCKRVAHDPQSGPIFCGHVAEFVARVDDSKVVALCERHPPPKT